MNQRAILVMTDIEPTTPLPDLTNAERLRTHLSKGSLAAALFVAWEAGDAAGHMPACWQP